MNSLIRFAATAVLLTSSLIPAASAAAADVRIVSEGDGWRLTVDGRPFVLKGIGAGRAVGKHGTDFFRLAKEAGANAVRTWGAEQGTRDYFDRAWRHGLYVAAGVWIDAADPDVGKSYLYEEAFTDRQTKMVLDYVEAHKDHPAILFWIIGSEALTHTEGEAEKLGLSSYLDGLAKRVKRLDPAHPVLYAAASPGEFPWLRDLAPNLDAIGINVYGSVGGAHGAWKEMKMARPYIVTEYAPWPPGDRPKDKFDLPIEARAQEKARRYRAHASEIERFRGATLGGFAFHLGDTSQNSLTWWNVNQGPLKTESFYAIREAYTGQPAPDLPRLKTIRIEPDQTAPGATVAVTAAVDPERPAPAECRFFVSTANIRTFEHDANKRVATTVKPTGFCAADIQAPADPGLYRVYVEISDGAGNGATMNRTLAVE